MPIKIAIIGCGAVVENRYKKALRKLERHGILRVVALVDKDIDRAEQLQKFFMNARAYDNLAGAIDKSGSNLAIIASPPAFHAEHSILALQNGNHVLCEKPMAKTKEECISMVQAGRRTNRLLAIGMTRRFYPSLVQAKHLIEKGELGDILSFSYREGEKYDWPISTPASFQRIEGGGGVLFDTGSHVLDTIIWLLGMPSIISYVDDAMGDGVEANCIVNIEVAGSTGVIQLSWDQDLANELRITGTRAEVIIALGSVDDFSMKKSGENRNYEKLRHQISFPLSTNAKAKMGAPKIRPDCFHFQIVQMIRAIELGESIPATGKQGAQVISIIEECYRIARSIDMAWLPPIQNDTYKGLHWRNKKWAR
jgi:predicted dehydrogenase